MRIPDEILQAADLLGVLEHEVEVRLLNISGSGCLLESACRIEPGATGTLRLRIGPAAPGFSPVEAEEFSDVVRVVRCQRIEGRGGMHQLGVQFLWATRPDGQSLRRVIGRFRDMRRGHARRRGDGATG